MDESLFLVVALGFLILMMFFSSRKRKKTAESLQSSLKKGATVMLTSGIYAVIVEVLEDRVVVETAPGNRMTVVKAAVRSVEKADVLSAVKPEAKKTTTKSATTKPSTAKPVAKKATKATSTSKK
jgi:preprotein translocase subunit YajC